MPNEFFHLRCLDRSISNRRGVWLVLLLPCSIEILVFNANSLDPDQTPHSAASDLGLGCLPMSHLWDARHKWVNTGKFTSTWLLKEPKLWSLKER